MNSNTIDLAPFLGEIENIISSISHDRLKKNVIAYARDLPPAKRFEFLQIIALDDESFDEHVPEEYVPDQGLQDEAETFLAKIKEGAYDHSLDINKPEDVPDWVDDMDILFDRADEAFMYNDRESAAKVYSTLFDALHIAEDIAVEHQMYSAQDIIISDMTETKARYFRALYETVPAKERAEAIYNAMRKNLAVGTARCGLQDMNETSSNELENLESFLPEWTELLKNCLLYTSPSPRD